MKGFQINSNAGPLLGQFQTNLAQASLGEGIQVYSNEELRPFPRGDTYEIVKIT